MRARIRDAGLAQHDRAAGRRLGGGARRGGRLCRCRGRGRRQKRNEDGTGQTLQPCDGQETACLGQLHRGRWTRGGPRGAPAPENPARGPRRRRKTAILAAPTGAFAQAVRVVAYDDEEAMDEPCGKPASVVGMKMRKVEDRS